jgi:hypothetical protein
MRAVLAGVNGVSQSGRVILQARRAPLAAALSHILASKPVRLARHNGLFRFNNPRGASERRRNVAQVRHDSLMKQSKDPYLAGFSRCEDS